MEGCHLMPGQFAWSGYLDLSFILAIQVGNYEEACSTEGTLKPHSKLRPLA